jgi:hypothetical protein
MDPLQEIFLVLVPVLLHILLEFNLLKFGALLKGLNT